MKIYTKSIKVFAVTKHELSALQNLVAEAQAKGKNEMKMSRNDYFAIECIDDKELQLHETERPMKARY